MSFARFSSGSSSNSFSRFNQEQDPYNTDQLDKQLNNANMRIQDAGYAPQDGDSRNWFEKATNLPQHQNAFFDALELISRPDNTVRNVLDKATGANAVEGIGEAALKGITGKEKVHGIDLLERDGQKVGGNGFSRFLAGTAIDVVTDPTMLIPSSAIAKAVSIPAKAIGKVGKIGYDAVESAIPALKQIRETKIAPKLTVAKQSVKDALGNMFVPKYGYENTLNGTKDNFLKDLTRTTDNAINFQTEEATRNIAKDAAAVGFDNGGEVSRVRESGLKINKDPKELLRDITQGKTVQANLAEGDLKDFVSKMNDSILNSVPVRTAIRQKTAQLDGVKSGLNGLDDEFLKKIADNEALLKSKVDKLDKRYNLNVLNRNVANGVPLTKVEENVLAKVQKYQDQHADKLIKLDQMKVDKFDRLTKAQGILEKDIAQKGRGIQFNPLETESQLAKGEGFEIINPQQRLYKKGIGNQTKFLDEISPKGNFGKVVKPELHDELKPIVENLLKEGKIVLPLMKGTPALTELRRIFGEDLKILNKKDTTLTLRQGNRDQQYFNLEGAKPVIPESLTAPNKVAPADGLKFDDVQFTDRGNPVNIPRPERVLSDSPIVHQAAQRIFDSNNELSQLAKANGIEIPEMEGYITHVLTEEARKAKRLKSVQGGNFGLGQPNAGVLKTRKYDGSIEDINELVDKPLFTDNAFIATAVGQKRLIEYIHAETFKKKVLENTSFAVPFTKGMTVPENTVVINPDNYKFFKVTTPDGNQFLSMGKGKEYIVTKGAKDALDRYQKVVTDEGTKSFLKVFDTVQSLWKKSALFSLGYHFRNQAGAMFNNYVAGMSALDLAKYSKEGLRETSLAVAGRESNLFREYRKQGLGSSSLSAVEFARAGVEPEQALAKTVENMSKSTGQKVSDRINPLNKSAWGNAFQTSKEVGDFFDQSNRFALFKWAIEKKGMNYEQAAQKVRDVQFDYSNTTNFEKNILTRVFPFYRWMRNNIPFQIKSFVNDPRKYTFLNNARLNAQGAVGLNEDNVPDYMKQQFTIPVYGKNGKGNMLGLSLPLSDLTKLSRPMKTLVDSASAIVKTPAELAVNYNAFRGKQIQKFQGQQQQYQIPYTDVAFGVPIKAGYAFDQLSGQIGRGVSGYLQKEDTKDQDILNRLPSLGVASIVKPFDAEAYAYYAKLDEVKQAQDLILYIEQQTGAKPKTVREINKK